MAPKVTTMGGEVAWRYKTQEELELTSPQRHHGVSSEREEAKRLAYSSLLRDAGETLKMCGHVQCCAAWAVYAELEVMFSSDADKCMPSDRGLCCTCSPMLAVAAATMLCHRFYAIQSMRSYDSWVRTRYRTSSFQYAFSPSVSAIRCASPQ